MKSRYCSGCGVYHTIDRFKPDTAEGRKFKTCIRRQTKAKMKRSIDPHQQFLINQGNQLTRDMRNYKFMMDIRSQRLNFEKMRLQDGFEPIPLKRKREFDDEVNHQLGIAGAFASASGAYALGVSLGATASTILPIVGSAGAIGYLLTNVYNKKKQARYHSPPVAMEEDIENPRSSAPPMMSPPVARSASPLSPSKMMASSEPISPLEPEFDIDNPELEEELDKVILATPVQKVSKETQQEPIYMGRSFLPPSSAPAIAPAPVPATIELPVAPVQPIATPHKKNFDVDAHLPVPFKLTLFEKNDIHQNEMVKSIINDIKIGAKHDGRNICAIGKKANEMFSHLPREQRSTVYSPRLIDRWIAMPIRVIIIINFGNMVLNRTQKEHMRNVLSCIKDKRTSWIYMGKTLATAETPKMWIDNATTMLFMGRAGKSDIKKSADLMSESAFFGSVVFNYLENQKIKRAECWATMKMDNQGRPIDSDHPTDYAKKYIVKRQVSQRSQVVGFEDTDGGGGYDNSATSSSGDDGDHTQHTQSSLQSRLQQLHFPAPPTTPVNAEPIVLALQGEFAMDLFRKATEDMFISPLSDILPYQWIRKEQSEEYFEKIFQDDLESGKTWDEMTPVDLLRDPTAEEIAEQELYEAYGEHLQEKEAWEHVPWNAEKEAWFIKHLKDTPNYEGEHDKLWQWIELKGGLREIDLELLFGVGYHQYDEDLEFQSNYKKEEERFYEEEAKDQAERTKKYREKRSDEWSKKMMDKFKSLPRNEPTKKTSEIVSDKNVSGAIETNTEIVM